MKYERFEQLPVWQAAIKLGREVYALTEGPAFKSRHSLRDQIERAAVSVSNNIAEGFERGTTQELLTFLYIARGSAGEVRSMLCLLEGIPAFADLRSQIPDLKSEAEQVSRQLRAWADSLQNSSISVAESQGWWDRLVGTDTRPRLTPFAGRRTGFPSSAESLP